MAWLLPSCLTSCFGKAVRCGASLESCRHQPGWKWSAKSCSTPSPSLALPARGSSFVCDKGQSWMNPWKAKMLWSVRLIVPEHLEQTLHYLSFFHASRTITANASSLAPWPGEKEGSVPNITQNKQPKNNQTHKTSLVAPPFPFTLLLLAFLEQLRLSMNIRASHMESTSVCCPWGDGSCWMGDQQGQVKSCDTSPFGSQCSPLP